MLRLSFYTKTICLASSFFLVGLSACKNTGEALLFQAEQDINPASFEESLQLRGKDFKITPADYLAISVYTSGGEVLIDPNREYQLGEFGEKGTNGLAGGQGGLGGLAGNQGARLGGNQFQTSTINNQSTLPINFNKQNPRSFLVNENGDTNLPMVGLVHLQGLTLYEADSVLVKLYSKFYENPFIKTQYINKRVTVVMPTGNRNIGLYNENLTIIEILTLAGIQEGRFQGLGKGNNIKLIRGESLKIIDLTTPEGIRLANIQVQPGDIIYVEPRRRRAIEDISENLSIVTIFTSAITALITFYIFIKNTN